MATVVMRDLKFPLRIPSNTLFANVKFRLKTTQLKTIFNSYPGGNYSGAIVQGKIALEEFHGGQLSKEELFGDNCSGVKSLGGNYPWGGIVRAAVIQGNCH